MTTNPNHNAVVADGGAVRALAELAAAAHGFDVLDVKVENPPLGLPASIPIGFGPDGDPVDLRPYFEKWRDKPERKTGAAKALTLDSFMELLERHKTAHSVVFAATDWKKPQLTAVIDYHPKESTDAAHGRHRVEYAFPLSEEWQAWVSQNGQPMGQADFAAFIEDRIADLSSPLDAEVVEYERTFRTTVATPSDIVGLSRGLQIAVDSRVKNIVTLQSGEAQMVFEEGHHDGTGQALKIPGLFVLAIAPFFAGEKIRVPVRLRYRAREGKVLWFFQLYRPDLYVTERIRDDLGEVRSTTGLPVFEGSPEGQS